MSTFPKKAATLAEVSVSECGGGKLLRCAPGNRAQSADPNRGKPEAGAEVEVAVWGAEVEVVVWGVIPSCMG